MLIAKLTGILDTINDEEIILNVSGVGYAVTCAEPTCRALPRVGEQVCLYIEHHFRQDSQQLFGFLTLEERAAFRLLQTVQGVGGRVALAILSVLTPSALVEAVTCQDKAAFARAEGVGPKLATRLVNELKDPIKKLGIVPTKVAHLPPTKGLALNDTVSALVNLGYRVTEATAAAQQAVAEHGSDGGVDQLIRSALQHLSRAG
jgi:Holliday junction DNA helicase RuvA